MQIGVLYQDNMDKSRKVKVVDTRGLCRVYFDGGYVGMTMIPVNLFEVPDRSYGFSPAGK